MNSNERSNAVSLPRWDRVRVIALDFDGVFTDNKAYVDSRGEELVKCDRRDGLGLRMIKNFATANEWSLDILILSKEVSSVVAARARKLKIDCYPGVDNKLDFLERYMNERKPADSDARNGLVYLGNDLNDLEAMKYASFSVAPKDSHERIKEVADVVLPHNGGDCFIRVFAERLLRIEEMSDEQVAMLTQ